MYIKKIVIEGYKSYGERTVIGPFHPGQNVIVGHNGAGKSNFFSAVQFVLGDEPTAMRQEQRHALLHEGSKSRSMTASVEIVFDNTDRRIAIDKNEVSLKRVIGAKSNKYILNKTVITKNEVISLMEVAGFSRSNPYYIVQQGKINNVASTPESRYELLREIAGVKVFEERRKESQAILDETTLKIRNIDELLNTINEKLETLKQETRELREFQEWDRRTRTIELIIYENEMSHSKTKLENLKAKHEELKKEQAELKKEVETYFGEIKTNNYDLKKAQREITNIEEERENLSKELDKLLTNKELLHFKINELDQDIALDNQNEASIKKKLEEVNTEIEKVQAELAITQPEYDNAVQKTEKIIRQLELQEQERQILYAKQGRSAQFQNKEERDAWINKELTAINKQIDEKLIHIKNLQNDIEENEQKFNELEKNRKMIMNDMEKQYDSISDFKKQCMDINKKKEEGLAKRKDLHKQEKKLQNDLEFLKEDFKKVNQHLTSLFGKAILNGISSVHKVLETFKNRPDMHRETDEYRGLLIQGFTCEERLYKAVEVTAGNRLFHHVVDSTKFGTEILKEMNRQGLPGVVSFMPLDNLRASNTNYQENRNAFPLVSRLEYSREYDIPVRYTFGKTIVARSLEIATGIARHHKLDCVTAEGDQVSSNGWLKGGHFGSSKSPMKLKADQDILEEAIESKKEELSALSEQIKNIDNEITLLTSRFQNTDTKYNKAKDTYDKLSIDLNNVKEQLGIIKDNQTLQNKNLLELNADLSNLQALKKNLEDELEQDLNHQLTEADQYQIDNLNYSITRFKKELKKLFKERESLETKKIQHENLLYKNLNCKKDELERQLREIGLENKQLYLQELKDELKRIENEVEKCKEEKKTNEEDYTQANKKKQDKLEDLEKLHGELRPKREMFEEKSKELEKLFYNINILEANRGETRNKINGLGVISNNDLQSRYSKMNIKSLYKELDKCRKKLKNYDHVNKKALYQYEMSKDQRDNLFKRKDELSRAREKIDELLQFLQEKRHEAVRFTFKQVGKYFRDIFRKIVPNGKAELSIVTEPSPDENDSSSTFDTLDFNSDKIKGVGIKVSFTENAPVPKEYNSLSGGEKALVALTLIFAIQKCDPAPFYLFDEIDQALDTTHREAVAQMIHELSSEAQFIVTTFRPELLTRANQFYGVRMQNNLSSIYEVSREEALEFLQLDQEEENAE